MITAQNESFEVQLPFEGLVNPDIPFPAIFIRAPAIHSLSPCSSSTSKETLCLIPSSMVPEIPDADNSPLGKPDDEAMRIVAMREGKKLVTSFHPELSGDLRVHEFFLRECCGLGK
jgi:5'-phosphate synthase pdxT subunit